MLAVIKKLQVKKIINSYYIKIELTDLEGYNYVINKPFLNDEINFKKQNIIVL